MSDDVIVEYGTDISSKWDFSDGDINIVSNKENIAQVIKNRLNTVTGSLDLFYEDYGSVLLSFLGWRRVDTTLEFIKVEVNSCISKDPRISNFETEVSFDEDGSVKINIFIYYNGIENFELNLVLDEDGVSEVSV